MNFNVNKEARKVAELLKSSKEMRRLLWGVVLAIPGTALIWKAADFIGAIAALAR